MGILARLRLAKIRTMARPNSPDMPPKRTKKVRLGILIYNKQNTLQFSRVSHTCKIEKLIFSFKSTHKCDSFHLPRETRLHSVSDKVKKERADKVVNFRRKYVHHNCLSVCGFVFSHFHSRTRNKCRIFFLRNTGNRGQALE